MGKIYVENSITEEYKNWIKIIKTLQNQRHKIKLFKGIHKKKIFLI